MLQLILELSGLQIDQNQKLRNGQMTIEQMEWWLNWTSETREGFVREELFADRRWRRGEDGVIYFPFPKTDGTTGPEWFDRLERKGIQISKDAKDVLSSSDFHPTAGVIYNIAVLPGSFFKDSERTTKNIRAEADRRNFTKPNAETACLIREKFSDEEIKDMGFWWVITMHEPIKNSDGGLVFLYALRGGLIPWLGADFGLPSYGWDRDNGFAFVVSQVSA